MENKLYTFGAWIDISAEDEDYAIDLFNDIRKMLGVKGVHCFEWKEVEA